MLSNCVEMNLLEQTKENNAYGQILKSLSIVGEAVGIDLLTGIVRNRFTAALIGANGVGLDLRNHVVMNKPFTHPLEILNSWWSPFKAGEILCLSFIYCIQNVVRMMIKANRG